VIVLGWSAFYSSFFGDGVAFDGVLPWGCDADLTLDQITEWNQNRLDDSSLEYEAEIPAEALEDLRFNPTTNEGMVGVDWFRILDNTGKTVRCWEF